MPKYWVVGATWSGEDQKEDFYKLGFWEMGWNDSYKPKLAAKRDSIEENDLDAIKTMDGQAKKYITIQAPSRSRFHSPSTCRPSHPQQADSLRPFPKRWKALL
ncbi:MAG: hypothetical protein U5P10_08010 [Spirochaetia bacterium]|nr:hypothetical protein [Spirochaetia bacterium]